MRIIFGILSFCAAGLLACHVVPMMQQLVLPYWLQGKSGGGFIQMGFGPIQLDEPQICIFERLNGLTRCSERRRAVAVAIGASRGRRCEAAADFFARVTLGEMQQLHSCCYTVKQAHRAGRLPPRIIGL